MARWTINLLIGIVFSTISPLMGPLAFIQFAVYRLNYGFLLVYAETPKTDLGGVFWVKALYHLQGGVLIYLTLMIGVLAIRPLTNGPLIVAAPALPLAIHAIKSFRDDFLWDRLPFEEVGKLEDTTGKHVRSCGEYRQRELDMKGEDMDGLPMQHKKTE